MEWHGHDGIDWYRQLHSSVMTAPIFEGYPVVLTLGDVEAYEDETGDSIFQSIEDIGIKKVRLLLELGLRNSEISREQARDIVEGSLSAAGLLRLREVVGIAWAIAMVPATEAVDVLERMDMTDGTGQTDVPFVSAA